MRNYPYILILTLSFALHESIALHLSHSSQCAPSAFNVSLNNIQCFGLVQVPNISTLDECATACCNDSACQMYEWCPQNTVCSGWPESSVCFTGRSDLNDCKSANGWEGKAQPNPPPPPSPFFPINFLTPYNGVSSLVESYDLGSTDLNDTTWSLTIDNNNATERTIAVPFGGYNSDEQNFPFINSASVATSATYTRTFTLPSSMQTNNNIVRTLEFGGCNHGCEIYIDNQLVGAHYGPLMPFAIDITNSTSSLQNNYRLTIVSHPFSYFNGYVPSSFIYEEAWVPPSDGWGSRLPEGISKYLRLSLYPSIRVSDTSIRTTVVSTSEPTFTANVTIVNDSDEEVCVQVSACFSPWNTDADWNYPTFALSNPVLLPPSSLPSSTPGIGNNRTTTTVTFTTSWLLDPSSYWWPNRPFNSSYVTQLHWFNVSILTSTGCTEPQGRTGSVLSIAAQRFGYVEHHESTSYYYLLNGVRMNHLSDATPESGMSYYDAYVSPAFVLPSSSPAYPFSGGVYDTWFNYMRIGMTSNRIHQSTPTQTMLDTADEIGFLLKPESPVRGCPGYETCIFNPVLLQSLAELVRFCKHSPSVFGYSIENESGGETTGPFAALIPSLIDTAFAEDSTRILTTEGSGGEPFYYGTNRSGYTRAVNNLHYAVPPHNLSIIQGVGECAWCQNNGMEGYSSLALQGRMNDVGYYAGWDWINYWSNFLEGMNASRHAWKQGGCAGRDRTDGVDGWNSPVVDWVQRAFHPYAIVDTATYSKNPIFNGTGWPYTVDQYTYTGEGNVTRSVIVFNDVLNSNDQPWVKYSSKSWYLQLNWRAVWDNANGTDIVDNGSVVVNEDYGDGQGYVRPGFHGTVSVTFPIPDPGTNARNLYIVMDVVRPADTTTVLYSENRTYITVTK